MGMLVFVLELPWDLGLPDEHSLQIDVPSGEDRATDSCLLVFRTVSVGAQLPLAASDLAFGQMLQDGGLGRLGRWRRARRRKRMTATPFPVSRTVVAAYVPTEDGPSFPDREVLSRGIATAIDAVNSCLVSVGVLYDDRLHPISVDDLPPLVPVMQALLTGERLEYGTSVTVPLRKPGQTVRVYDEKELEQIDGMVGLITSEDRLVDFYESVQRAGSARRAGRHRESVVDYGTAGELFVTALLRLVGERRGMDEAKLDNIVAGPFKDRVGHLCRLIGVPDDPEDPQSPMFYWWLHCYQQRNKIVHRGADSIGMLSETARIGTVTMVVDVREAIRRDEEIAEIGSLIRWGYRVDQTEGGTDSYPDPPPPRA